MLLIVLFTFYIAINDSIVWGTIFNAFKFAWPGWLLVIWGTGEASQSNMPIKIRQLGRGLFFVAIVYSLLLLVLFNISNLIVPENDRDFIRHSRAELLEEYLIKQAANMTIHDARNVYWYLGRTASLNGTNSYLPKPQEMHMAILSDISLDKIRMNKVYYIFSLLINICGSLIWLLRLRSQEKVEQSQLLPLEPESIQAPGAGSLSASQPK